MSATSHGDLTAFVCESNRIEGIVRDPTGHEIDAHYAFLALPRVRVADVEAFVRVIAAVPLRRAVGQDVSVGTHVPPHGGPEIDDLLSDVLASANGNGTPWDVHCQYELLHPFMDGNGRSGRALWAWMMLREGRNPFGLPFLHRWYYQTLDAARRP